MFSVAIEAITFFARPDTSQRIGRMETMKVQVDELSILVGLDGLEQAKPPQDAAVEELVAVVTAETLLRALQAERWEDELKLYRLLN